MAYQSQSLKEITRQLENDIATELELSSLPPICTERAVAFGAAAAKRDTHDHIDWLSKQIVPSSKSDEQTIVERAAYEGVPRKLEKKAAGTATIKGQPNSRLPVDSLLQHANGLRYVVTNANIISDGEIAFDLQCTTTGREGNLTGEVMELTLVNPVPGLESKAAILTMDGGANREPIGELLGRLYFRKQNPPMGGAEHDYKAWAIEVPEVTRAWPYDMYQGGSTMGLAFVCDNLDDIIPTDAKQQEVSQYIYRHQDPATGIEVGAPGGIELVMFKLRLKTVQLDITLTPDNDQTRAAVKQSLNALERDKSNPNSTIKLSHVRTAIGSTNGIDDYHCTLTADITSEEHELITFGEPVWGA
ncbi:baseplate J/gp47 family protein [Vibrio sp. LaRot3]|uniref:baseplate J/gp47 family protein n=1 Tax=Vibrio sp. LaRot3 TaxID=2998829 RepID=UPI0022CE303D|nr:baseplate J/gp47 family protein [Vibrio sp. LaRot3]MDA0148863.1 baseplate J/gp47 family protein [Vibrio sp. LaRot3]